MIQLIYTFLNKRQVKTNGFILLIGIICFSFTEQWSWKGSNHDGIKHVISSDGHGYYKYLSNTFIHKNITDQPIDNRFILENNNGKGYNKYYSGTSIFMAPFFIPAHLIAKTCGYTKDGYSTPYQMAISFAGLFHLMAGLYFLSKLLYALGFKPIIVSIALISIVFGTNLFSYTVLMPSMSHIYSFFCITCFLWCYHLYFTTRKNKFHYYGVLLFVAIILIRPLNGVIIFALPFLSYSWKSFLYSFKRLLYPNSILISVTLLLLLSIQLIAWYIQTGSFYIWSYKGEGFEFFSPHIIDVLFSFRKGWFIYTPLALVSLFGIFLIWKKSSFKGISLALFFILLIYLISSWWNWYYGPSFSQRPFVEFYALIAISLAYVINYLYQRTRFVTVIVLFLFIGLNLIQNYQYAYNIISSWDMNWKKYQYTFLQTSPVNSLGGNNDIFPFKAQKEVFINSANTFTLSDSIWTNGTLYKSKGNSASDYSGKEFNTSLNYIGSLNKESERGLYFEVSLDKKQTKAYASQEALLVFDIKGKNGYRNYYSFKLDEVPNKTINTWKTSTYQVEIPDFRSDSISLSFYIWNKQQKDFMIDNIYFEGSSLN